MAMGSGGFGNGLLQLLCCCWFIDAILEPRIGPHTRRVHQESQPRVIVVHVPERSRGNGSIPLVACAAMARDFESVGHL
jgi:hypothetical protein